MFSFSCHPFICPSSQFVALTSYNLQNSTYIFRQFCFGLLFFFNMHICFSSLKQIENERSTTWKKTYKLNFDVRVLVHT